MVKQQLLNAQNNMAIIDATELNAGVYYYSVKDGTNDPKAQKLIILK